MSDLFLTLFDLQSRILAATRPVETAFLAVDLAHTLVPYRQAVLWSRADGTLALSGAASVDDGSPYVLWLGQVLRAVPVSTAPQPLTAADLPAALAEPWGDWLPGHVLLLPMADEVLLYAREEEFTEQETALLAHLATLVRVSRRALAPRSTWRDRLKALDGRRSRVIAFVALAAALFPVTGSVLAPADSVPAHPVIVRAPLDGVVDRIAVQPHASVAEGQELFNLDATALSGKLDVARSQWATAEAEYRQAAQAMVFDAKAKAQVAILAGKAEEKAAEVRLLDAQLVEHVPRVVGALLNGQRAAVVRTLRLSVAAVVKMHDTTGLFQVRPQIAPDVAVATHAVAEQHRGTVAPPRVAHAQLRAVRRYNRQ